MARIYSLSKDEVEILRLGKDNPDIITNYFFRAPNMEKGWIFDYMFEDWGKWQKMVHLAKQTRIVVIGGYGSGKTQGIAMSACTWAMTTLDFKFMNAAPVSWQTELMYHLIMDMAEDTPFGKLIYEHPKRPYPKITLKFYVGQFLVNSSLEFMSVDENAAKILSWDGDWLNIDEAGKIDNLSETIKNAGSRLRGKTKRGRPRLGRFSMCSNSWDNPEMWYRFDMASALPEEHLSLTVSTRANKNITPEQLRDILKDVPEDEWDQFIEGNRPQGAGMYFSNNSVHSCESKTLSDFVKDRIKSGDPDYIVASTSLAGVVVYEMPVIADHVYIELADPGTGEAPNRNAPVVMVWDVTDFPKNRAVLVGLWWGAGHGSITPFLVKYFQLMMKYKPIYNGVDSTGTQKGTAELLNTYILDKDNVEKTGGWLGQIDLTGILDKTIHGLDFSGGKKPIYLINARLMLEAKLMMWSDMIVGIRSQLTNYDPAKDRTGEPKISQDLVSAFAMSAHTIRALFHISTSEFGVKNEQKESDISVAYAQRSIRLGSEERNNRSVYDGPDQNDQIVSIK
jgi:hypothetical protein